MCGIVGLWDHYDGNVRASVVGMSDRIRHRGPDGCGTWIDEQGSLGLGHRRLSIIDLSESGKQPMVSRDGRFVLTFNGEIYNHLDIRAELNGLTFNEWRGHSDSETLVEALGFWGIREALNRLNGMFAFGLFDRVSRRLFLARDRMGEKPLYFGCSGGAFLFGSELKAFEGFARWQPEIDRDSLTSYFRFSYVPGSTSIYKHISKLLPAHYVIIENEGKCIGDQECYWDLSEICRDGALSPHDFDEEEGTEALDKLLGDAVKLRMASDVPLGGFLSGGIDSSLVVALMQAQSTKAVKTFTIGFHEEDFNEAKHALSVARHLGTDHTELYLNIDQAAEVIPQLASIWDEPFADASQIPMLLVSELARRDVTVSLSGDGGDELFHGYWRYFRVAEFARWQARLPNIVKRAGIGLLGAFSGEFLDRIGGHLPGSWNNHLGDRLKKLSDVVEAETSVDLYHRMMSHWKDPAALVLGGKDCLTLIGDVTRWPDLPSLSEQMTYIDSVSYLPDDILTKVDRASMAHSLEARVPLLDHRVVEFASATPMKFKYKRPDSKWLLRQVLYKYVPCELLNRPKMGFGVPLGSWLRGPLRDWAEELLDENRLRREGYLNPDLVRKVWNEHLSGRRRWHDQLWDVLMFQAWKERME